MWIRLVLVLTVLATLPTGCAGDPVVRSTPSMVSDCPATRNLRLGTCHRGQAPGYGTSPARPLQWGVTAAGGLYFGRLVCPSGALATAHRKPRQGAVVPWEVECPGDPAPHVWYTEPNRCADPCPPEGFSVIPDDALQTYVASLDAQQAGDSELALKKAKEAAHMAPANEMLGLWLAQAMVQAGQAQDAVPLFEAVVRMNPEDPEPKLFLAMAQRAAGHPEPYHAAVADLLAKLPPSHPLLPELQCLRAEHLQELGQHPEAQKLATASCEGGWQGCCKRP